MDKGIGKGLMAKPTSVNGKMESRKDMEFLLIKMETDIKDNSKIQ
jgi:hypothetical protein